MKLSPWADTVGDIQNGAGVPLYKKAELKWSRPTIWSNPQKAPSFDTEEPFLYALIRNHGNAKTKDHIEYIGLTKKPKTRFGNHETAHEIACQGGTVTFSYAPINFITGRNKLARIEKALEEIEHLLIWAVPSDKLWNEQKMYTLPGLGAKGGNAWHIVNTGYRFCGQMPREIIFPWMAIVPGRDRSAR